MKIRLIKESDAEEFLKLSNQIDCETEFVLFEPGERDIDVEEQARRIKRNVEDPNTAIWVLETEEKLVGYLGAFGNSPKRIQHVVYIAIGIIQEWVGKGFGTKLFQELEDWAKERGMYRLELSVMTHNEAGIALYNKMGFEIEGVKRHSLLINGKYVDEYYMSKLI